MSTDGPWAVTASRDGTAQRWKVDDGRPVGAPLRHRGALKVVQIDAEDLWFVTGPEDGTARVWELATGRPITPPLRHQSRIRNLQFSPGGTRLFVAADGNPTIWTLVAPSAPTPLWLPELAEALAHRPSIGGDSNGESGQRFYRTATNQFPVTTIQPSGPHAVGRTLRWAS
jgi:hypothetical protein